ncbi:hypothetical protein CYLTODRAFT_422102 [Cylindrobasidium torrendii FP15055 ss-10]|uniref:Transmembrane protein n=1 Tax=Cylindrobasidium torrendii FP15055 ss-10 TaxID=1314674 RepID=A0A0D7BBJ9_9AGAR|nr:hypothetical protein CYLTODRAFT_422102 [Cylindrobasidium torrendii FP15055 ss-10]
MFSFAKIFGFAALGLSALSAAVAAPTSPNMALRSLEARCGCETVATTVSTVVVDVQTIAYPIIYGTSANITVDVVKVAIGDIKVKLDAAIVALEASAELSVNETLVFAGGLLTLDGLATLLCTILGLVLALVKIVFTILSKADCEILKPLIAELLTLVCHLLQVVVGLVDGLLAVLVSVLLSFTFTIVGVVSFNLVAVLGAVIGLVGCVLGDLLGFLGQAVLGPVAGLLGAIL